MKKEFNLEEEVQDDFIVTTERKKIWKVELDLLEKFINVCEKYNITYFLDGGTLLGAIRHGGFIPWDDDIDVILLRDDYDKLISISDKEFKFPYFFQSTYSEENYFRGHCQLRNSLTCAMLPIEANCAKFNQGIFIDIFVLDNLETDKNKLKKRFKKLLKYKRRMRILICESFYTKNKFKRYLKKIRKAIVKILFGDLRKNFEKFETVAKQCYERNTEYVDAITFRNNIKDVKKIKKEWFNEKQIVKFEYLNCTIPKEYDCLLKEYYGENYMIPQNIPSKHNACGNVIFNTEKSYIEVIKGEDNE